MVQCIRLAPRRWYGLIRFSSSGSDGGLVTRKQKGNGSSKYRPSTMSNRIWYGSSCVGMEVVRNWSGHLDFSNLRSVGLSYFHRIAIYGLCERVDVSGGTASYWRPEITDVRSFSMYSQLHVRSMSLSIFANLAEDNARISLRDAELPTWHVVYVGKNAQQYRKILKRAAYDLKIYQHRSKQQLHRGTRTIRCSIDTWSSSSSLPTQINI